MSLSILGNKRNHLSRYTPSALEVVYCHLPHDGIEERHVGLANQANTLRCLRDGLVSLTPLRLCFTTLSTITPRQTRKRSTLTKCPRIGELRMPTRNTSGLIILKKNGL